MCGVIMPRIARVLPQRNLSRVSRRCRFLLESVAWIPLREHTQKRLTSEHHAGDSTRVKPPRAAFLRLAAIARAQVCRGYSSECRSRNGVRYVSRRSTIHTIVWAEATRAEAGARRPRLRRASWRAVSRPPLHAPAVSPSRCLTQRDG